MMKPEKRKTAGQMAAKASGGAGLECSNCGCRDFRVRDTKPGVGYIKRYRICRHCGRIRTTIEV